MVEIPFCPSSRFFSHPQRLHSLLLLPARLLSLEPTSSTSYIAASPLLCIAALPVCDRKSRVIQRHCTYIHARIHGLQGIVVIDLLLARVDARKCLMLSAFKLCCTQPAPVSQPPSGPGRKWDECIMLIHWPVQPRARRTASRVEHVPNILC